jgi:hypothetical protein
VLLGHRALERLEHRREPVAREADALVADGQLGPAVVGVQRDGDGLPHAELDGVVEQRIDELLDPRPVDAAWQRRRRVDPERAAGRLRCRARGWRATSAARGGVRPAGPGVRDVRAGSAASA